MSAKKTVVAYKGFDLALKCRDHQFEVGKTYTHEGNVEACKSGFHACEHPLDVFGYYSPATSRYAIVTQAGDLARHDDDSKVASSIITIKAELSLHGLIQAAVEYTFSRAKKVKSTASATNGTRAHSATNGMYANSATNGTRAHSATNGMYAHSATNGTRANSATNGTRAHSATNGMRANSATNGMRANSATNGTRAHSATNGDDAHSATNGDDANSATNGMRANSEAKGAHSVAASLGSGASRAGETGAIFIVERNTNYEIIAVFASKVGENGIQPHTWYALRDGKPVEVTP